MIEVIVQNFWSIVGAILLACFSAWLAWRHNLKNRRLEASDKFRKSILTELYGLYPIPTDWPEHSHDIVYLLKQKFPSLVVAVEEYRNSVRDEKGFTEAWNYFRRGNIDSAIGEQDYFQYTGTCFDNDPPPNPRKIFKENVDRLLSFCEKT